MVKSRDTLRTKWPTNHGINLGQACVSLYIYIHIYIYIYVYNINIYIQYYRYRTLLANQTNTTKVLQSNKKHVLSVVGPPGGDGCGRHLSFGAWHWSVVFDPNGRQFEVGRWFVRGFVWICFDDGNVQIYLEVINKHKQTHFLGLLMK